MAVDRCPSRSIARTAAIIAGCLGLALLSLSATAAETFGVLAPDLALLAFPPSANARAELAMIRFTDGEREEARQLASASLARKPANAEALRVLGLALPNQSHAAALLRLSERLSRRDQETQLALIEVEVGTGDIAGALVHYDRAMVVRPELAQMLIPVLVRASEGVEVRTALARQLARRPIWWGSYLSALALGGTSPAAMESGVRAVHLRPDVPDEAATLSTIFYRLATLGAWPELSRLAHDDCSGTCDLVRNGGFNHEPRLMPLDWIVSPDPGASSIEPGVNGRTGALLLRGDGTDHGTRQLLLLVPGRYALGVTMQTAWNADHAPTVTLQCSNGDGVLRTRVPPRPFSRAAFVIPTGCTAQWLMIEPNSGDRGGDDEPSIGKIAVTAL